MKSSEPQNGPRKISWLRSFNRKRHGALGYWHVHKVHGTDLRREGLRMFAKEK
jgi:hypothetical protein